MSTASEDSQGLVIPDKRPAKSKKRVSTTNSRKIGYLETAARLQTLSISSVAVLLFCYVFLLHLGALSLFTKGFLLKRTTLQARNTCLPTDVACTLEPKFDRLVILLVDALRYDFLFPVSVENPDYDATHHNHLSVPIELSKSSPAHSIMYKSIADPPTATLQRLKALTTGSLPTFVDVGSNFAGSRVDEDNWLEQANRIGKKIAFMGDDTWLTIFPETVFAANQSFPFDSFNVEDLDTVDEGVIRHMLPLLNQPSTASSWDILIAHTLGLDHAGHRFGASHPQTTRKLKETNELIRKTVERLQKKDLLVVLGDHGMDSKGDHGGDSPEEVEAALWLYSKSPLVSPDLLLQQRPNALTHALASILRTPAGHVDGAEHFGLDGIQHRRVSQISLVPTLCLLLGLPIPLNNLGTLIPELFMEENKMGRWGASKSTPSKLQEAMTINGDQMKTYLENYAAHSGSSDLEPYIPKLLQLHEKAKHEASDDISTITLMRQFTYSTLDATRSIWARFDPYSMGAGIGVLLASVLVLIHLYRLSKLDGGLWRTGAIRLACGRALTGALIGFPVGLAAHCLAVTLDIQLFSLLQLINLSVCLGSVVGVLSLRRAAQSSQFANGLISDRVEPILAVAIAVLHTAGFASNSYILWEDYVTLYLGQLQPFLILIRGLTTQDAALKKRMIKLALLNMACMRIMSFSTICREEQHPYCKATFYGSSGISISSPSAMFAAFIAALALPSVLGKFLDLSKSRQAWAPFYLRYSFRGLLVGGTLYWVADYLEFTGKAQAASQLFKITIARVLLMFGILLATTFWPTSPLCVDVQQNIVQTENGESKSQVTIIGFANSIASSYLILFSTIFGFLFLLFQPIGQVTSSIAVVAYLALIEAIDNERDAATVNAVLEKSGQGISVEAATIYRARPPSFLSLCTLALWGFNLFFATGHQAVLSAIQWKTAFVGFPVLTYPFSPILVVLNTLGPFILSAAALPLLVFWNVAPSLKGGKTIPVLSHLVTASLGFLLYHTLLALSSAIFAAHLRRHLMVWKVFAPRFMLSALTLLAVDLTIIIVSIGWGGIGTLKKLAQMYGTAWQ